MNPTRVLLVGPLPPPPGGIAGYVRALSKATMPGVTMSVFDTSLPSRVAPMDREGGWNYSSLLESGVTVALRMMVFALASYPRFAWRLIRFRPEIVHGFTCSYWGYWRIVLYLALARLLRRRTVLHLLNAIDAFFEQGGRPHRALLRLSFRAGDVCVVQSPGLARWLRLRCRCPVVSIWNGIDIEGIPAKAQAPPALATLPRPIGITVGKVGRDKGTGEVLAALATLAQRGTQIGWVFVGGGNLPHYRRIAEQHGLSAQVIFTGYVRDEEKWQYLHHADLFCLPSFAEGQPISIIEAMCVGRPVIATRVGSIPEMLIHGETGLLLDPGDREALVACIERLCQAPEERRRLGDRGRAQATTRHRAQRVYEEIRALYAQLGRRKLDPGSTTTEVPTRHRADDSEASTIIAHGS